MSEGSGDGGLGLLHHGLLRLLLNDNRNHALLRLLLRERLLQLHVLQVLLVRRLRLADLLELLVVVGGEVLSLLRVGRARQLVEAPRRVSLVVLKLGVLRVDLMLELAVLPDLALGLDAMPLRIHRRLMLSNGDFLGVHLVLVVEHQRRHVQELVALRLVHLRRLHSRVRGEGGGGRHSARGSTTHRHRLVRSLDQRADLGVKLASDVRHLLVVLLLLVRRTRCLLARRHRKLLDERGGQLGVSGDSLLDRVLHCSLHVLLHLRPRNLFRTLHSLLDSLVNDRLASAKRIDDMAIPVIDTNYDVLNRARCVHHSDHCQSDQASQGASECESCHHDFAHRTPVRRL
mmetsp:Transcript_66094/g.137769  ORF Transcript_66094/g.137769 Transcript_66094/m.137769 type:complete len:345 (-) Transcript_66094:62-1096(-)